MRILLLSLFAMTQTFAFYKYQKLTLQALQLDINREIMSFANNRNELQSSIWFTIVTV